MNGAGNGPCPVLPSKPKGRRQAGGLHGRGYLVATKAKPGWFATCSDRGGWPVKDKASGWLFPAHREHLRGPVQLVPPRAEMEEGRSLVFNLCQLRARLTQLLQQPAHPWRGRSCMCKLVIKALLATWMLLYCRLGDKKQNPITPKMRGRDKDQP